MKKKFVKTILILLLINVFLFPMPTVYKDGGSTRYKALLYEVYRQHQISFDSKTGFKYGTIVKILGFEVYNNIDR